MAVVCVGLPKGLKIHNIMFIVYEDMLFIDFICS